MVRGGGRGKAFPAGVENFPPDKTGQGGGGDPLDRSASLAGNPRGLAKGGPHLPRFVFSWGMEQKTGEEVLVLQVKKAPERSAQRKGLQGPPGRDDKVSKRGKKSGPHLGTMDYYKYLREFSYRPTSKNGIQGPWGGKKKRFKTRAGEGGRLLMGAVSLKKIFCVPCIPVMAG